MQECISEYSPQTSVCSSVAGHAIVTIPILGEYMQAMSIMVLPTE